MTKYILQDKQLGDVIETFNSLSEANNHLDSLPSPEDFEIVEKVTSDATIHIRVSSEFKNDIKRAAKIKNLSVTEYITGLIQSDIQKSTH